EGVLQLPRWADRAVAAAVPGDVAHGHDGASEVVWRAVPVERTAHPEAGVDVRGTGASQREVSLRDDEGPGGVVVRHDVLAELDVVDRDDRVLAVEGGVVPEVDGPAHHDDAGDRVVGRVARAGVESHCGRFVADDHETLDVAGNGHAGV